MAISTIKIYESMGKSRIIEASHSFFSQEIKENKWGDFMEKVSTPSSTTRSISYIYKLMQPSDKNGVIGTLEVRTPEEKETFLSTFKNNPLATCEKIHFFDIIRLSRIYLSKIQNSVEKKRVTTALIHMADRAETKYNKNFMGLLRRIYSCVCNFFKSKRSINLSYLEEMFPEAKDHVPFFVGSDANFARLVAKSYSSD